MAVLANIINFIIKIIILVNYVNTALVVPIYQNQIFEYKQYILLRNSFCGVFHSWSMDIQNPHPTFPYAVSIHWHI